MFQNILSKVSNYNLEIFQSVLGFSNASLCLYFMYKYQKTKDINLFKKGAVCFFFPYLIIDLLLNIYLIMNNSSKTTCLEAICHHIITFFISIWVYWIGLDIIPDIAYIFVLFESSTIFLIMRHWFKEYMKAMEEKTVPVFMTILQTANDFIFFIIFIYFRCYVFLKDVIFNKSFYERILSSGSFPNKLFICVIFAFFILNIYWTYMVCKSGYKKINSMINDKSENNYVDEEIMLIEKIKAQLINSRSSDKC